MPVTGDNKNNNNKIIIIIIIISTFNCHSAIVVLFFPELAIFPFFLVTAHSSSRTLNTATFKQPSGTEEGFLSLCEPSVRDFCGDCRHNSTKWSIDCCLFVPSGDTIGSTMRTSVCPASKGEQRLERQTIPC